MAARVEPRGSEKMAGVRLEIPATENASLSQSPSPPRMPKRLRERLLECKTSSPTVGEIEAKLRDADLRRQKFYDELSSKARQKSRSPSQSSPHEEDLGQRLEAKLQAAEQKRLSILTEAQMRLARLDKLRRAAKTGVELRFEKKRERLGSEVESRFLQAEANRMLILSTYGQRRATVKERRSQSVLRRMVWESKYKECMRTAIYQKRAAAERNRLRLLEAEKKRARARVLQVRRVAKSVLHQREIERRRKEDQLEDRLQRARRQRAEFLRQRTRLNGSVRVNWNRIPKQADVLSRKIARCWRRFRKLRRTTFALAKAYDALKINNKAIKSMPFEQLACLIESNATLQTVKCLLDRFESRFKLLQAVATPSPSPSCDNIDHLLKRVASPNRRSIPRNSTRSRVMKKQGSRTEASKEKLSRYQVRVVLCAYMILGHPDAVFSEQGERESSLTKSAKNFIREFELLIKIILDGPIQSSDEETDAGFPRRRTFRTQLAAFDREWCIYLDSFVMWKVKDAKSLEEDLVRAACQLELSMIQTCKMTPDGYSVALTHDMKAIKKQVTEDQKLLREKVRHLSGEAGIERMEHALSDTRTKYFQAKGNGSPLSSPVTGFPTPSPHYSPATESSSRGSYGGEVGDNDRQSSRVVRSLFQTSASTIKENLSDPRSSLDQLGVFSGEPVVLENELIVNEVVHDQHLTLAESVNIAGEDRNSIKGKIRETMEKAFWDGIIESMKQDEPNYDRVVDLVREVRDEFCEIAPKSWKQDITEAIDLDILSQVLKSGNLDMNYLGKILDFALVTLQKLSAPANDDELKTTHEKLLIELAELYQSRNKSNYMHVIAMVKGLRFVLEQIQALKQEISKARIRMMEPLLKGPAGLDYLKTAFANRYGSPSNALNSLPATVQWLSSVVGSKDQEWSEHTHYLSALTNHSSSQVLPSTSLKTGVHLPVKTNGSRGSSLLSAMINSTDNQQLECKGDKVDLLVRLGLLKLVTGVPGLRQETLPETLKLNLSRLRGVQAQVQKIIVISTSVLICQQILLSEQAVSSAADLESIVSECVKQLWDCLDGLDDVGIKGIVEIISGLSKDTNDFSDAEKLQSRKEVMARMLAKGLQDGDAIFGSVSHTVYLAMRGVVLGGNGNLGRALAEMALRKVGGGALTSKVVEAAGVLAGAATVSVSVHGPWYAHLIEEM